MQNITKVFITDTITTFQYYQKKVKKRMSIRRKGVPKSEEHKRKISEGNKGKKRTNAMKKRQSEK